MIRNQLKSVSNRKRGPQLPVLIAKQRPQNRVVPVIHHFENNTTIAPPGRFGRVPSNSEIVPTTPKGSKPVLMPPLPTIHQCQCQDFGFESFLNELSGLPLYAALEAYFINTLDANNVYVWQVIPGLQVLYSYSRKETCSNSVGIVGSVFYNRSILRMQNPHAYPSFSAQYDSKVLGPSTPVMVFPLWDFKNSVYCVVEVVRSSGSSEFLKSDEEIVETFSKSFKPLSRWIQIPRSIEPLILDITQLLRDEQYLKITRQKISQFFNCRVCEIWKYSREKNDLTRYSEQPSHIDTADGGIAQDSLIHEQIINCISNQLHCSYNAKTDGPTNEAVLSVPITESEKKFVYSVVLRGPKSSPIFTPDDEDALKRSAPLIALTLENSNSFTAVDDEAQHSHIEREGLAGLLEVAEILSSQLDKDQLMDTIMEKGRQLTNADRCSLFIVNEKRDRLVTSLQHGLNNSIDIPIDKGIAGTTFTEGKIMNIADVYESEFFDPTVDQETGYRTRSILSVPIYNNRGEIIGVTEMVNKLDNKPFTQWDIDVIQIFNVFCGISLENAALYKESNEQASQLRSFFNISFSLSNTEDIKRLLSDILQNARKTINAECGSLFLLDESAEVLSSYIVDGGVVPPSIPLTSGVAATCVKSKQGIIVNDVYHSPQFNRNVDQNTGFKTRSLLAAPLISATGELMGVAEMVNKNVGSFGEKDLTMLNSFATFASVALEKGRLKEIAKLGDMEIELKKWIGESERKSCSIPIKLQLPEESKNTICTLNFFSVDFKGIGHYRQLFYIFNRLNLLEAFQISSELLYRFVFRISEKYNDVPYHNWTHACDVTQYIFFQILTANLQSIYSNIEIFALIMTGICHDANHHGLNNIFNVKAETPLGILYKDQSVMEMHHTTVSIQVLSEDETNLFHSLNSADSKLLWGLFIKLVLATDMAKHFEIVKKTNALFDEGKFSITDPEHRVLSMQLLIKMADISNVSRPFNIADKWCDILMQEFFRQGDLEKSTGIGLTSPLNDREHPDKPKSQIGFYNFICLPLYQVVIRVFPDLQLSLDSVKSNLSVWMSMVEAKKNEAEKK